MQPMIADMYSGISDEASKICDGDGSMKLITYILCINATLLLFLAMLSGNSDAKLLGRFVLILALVLSLISDFIRKKK